MSNEKELHVVKRGDDWALTRAGRSRAISVHDTQSDAIDRGREIAKKERGELVIHRPDGKIRDKDSYGNDPCPPRDTKH